MPTVNDPIVPHRIYFSLMFFFLTKGKSDMSCTALSRLVQLFLLSITHSLFLLDIFLKKTIIVSLLSLRLNMAYNEQLTGTGV